MVQSIGQHIQGSKILWLGMVSCVFATMVSGQEPKQAVNAQNPTTMVTMGVPSQDSLLYKNAKTKPFSIVSRVPVFPGCENARYQRECFNEKLQEHIHDHIHYRDAAIAEGFEGRISAGFTVGADGAIHHITAIGPMPLPLLEQEVKRVLSLLPHMQPGMLGDELVNVPFFFPVYIILKP